jgi:hypothetical protein
MVLNIEREVVQPEDEDNKTGMPLCCFVEWSFALNTVA